MARSIDEAGYWMERDQQMRAEVAADAERAQSAMGRMEQVQRELERAYTLRREGLATDADVAGAQAALVALERAGAVAEREEWTADVTTARRAAWNTAIRQPANRTRDGKTVLVAKVERTLGFTVAALKAAVARHGL